MIQDKVLAGVLIGLFADVVKLIINYLFYLFNFTNVVFWQITAARFLDRNDLFKPAAYFIGAIADLTVTVTLGIVFVYVIYFTGKNYLWMKGVGFGLVVWVGLFGTLLGQAVQAKLPQAPSGIMVTIAAHLVFGLGLAGFARMLYSDGNEEVPKEESEEERMFKRVVPVPAKKIISSDARKGQKESPKSKFKKPIKLKGSQVD